LSSLHLLGQGHPPLLDVPWELPLEEWEGRCPRLVHVTRGLSRHTVVFVSYGAAIYALKEMPVPVGEREFLVLRELESRGLPSVTPVGLARTRPVGGDDERSVLITRYLDGSLPFRALFMHQGLERYRERLLDAMASLLVRLHLGGLFWGDCSLSNTLFRRDAGELQACMVDAETSEVHGTLSAGQRLHDLVIMEENVTGELGDLAAMVNLPPALPVYETAANIRRRYERLWGEINQELVVAPLESYRIQERIKALNELGFSVGEVELVTAGDGNQLRMRTMVTDRDYHRHALHGLTGVVAGERQAALMLNEIRALQGSMIQALNRSVPLSVAAFRWLEERFIPTEEKLRATVGAGTELTELYCQVLEHKWFLSERAKQDVGLERSLEDYLGLMAAKAIPVVPGPPAPPAMALEPPPRALGTEDPPLTGPGPGSTGPQSR
jgi:hypothetical protein